MATATPLRVQERNNDLEHEEIVMCFENIPKLQDHFISSIPYKDFEELRGISR